jgi:hypothetical protein
MTVLFRCASVYLLEVCEPGREDVRGDVLSEC